MTQNAVSDDLSTPNALVVLEKATGGYVGDRLKLVASMDAVLGLNLLTLTRADLRIRPTAATITKPEIDAILAQREEARAAKDFTTSDRLRDELATHGVEVMDGDPSFEWDWKLGE